jgi:hypothetical protein
MSRAIWTCALRSGPAKNLIRPAALADDEIKAAASSKKAARRRAKADPLLQFGFFAQTQRNQSLRTLAILHYGLLRCRFRLRLALIVGRLPGRLPGFLPS